MPILPGSTATPAAARLVWIPEDAVAMPSGRAGPGLFVDPCSGARFDRDGNLVRGPADRGLDEFATLLDLDGIVVDTRALLCGPPPPDASPTPSPRDECEPVSRSDDFR